MKTNNVKNRVLPLPEAVSKGLEPEAKIQDFEIKRELGAGSFGRVFLVMHKKTKALYAIKAIDKRNKANLEETPYFRREIEIMYKIRHPNVVRLYSHFEDDKYIYFIMEYVSKGNIYNLMSKEKNRKVPLETVANLMKDVISAVYFLHNMNPPIVHRDIKPENVLLTEENVCKLTDFGWSNYLSDEEKRTTVCGTPIYLAPEIINEQGHDERVDIWCIGVLLFELCTGSVPFLGNDIETLKANIRHMKINWPKDITLEAKNLISKILKYNPKDRLPLSQIINHAFFTKILQNVNQYLIKPDENMQHIPFIVSKDDPKDEPKFEPKEPAPPSEESKTSNEENEIKKSCDNKENKSTKEDESIKGLKEELKIVSSQKDELVKECVQAKERVKELEKKMVGILRETTHLDKAKGTGCNEEEYNNKIYELEKENSNLKEKCEKYEKMIQGQKNTNEKDQEIMKLKEELASSIEKEKKRYSAIIIKYEAALKKLLKENQELKGNQ